MVLQNQHYLSFKLVVLMEGRGRCLNFVIRWRSQVTGPPHCITSEGIVVQAL